MKTKFDNQGVVAAWARQNQYEGYNARGSLFFRDRTIYSYGGHFPIAKFVANAKGERAILLTTRGYSVTTSAHVARVREEAGYTGLPVFLVHNPAESGKDAAKDLLDYAKKVSEAIGKAARARSEWRRESWTRDAVELAKEARDFARFFGLPAEIKAPEDAVEVYASYLHAQVAEGRSTHSQVMAELARICA